MAIVSPASASRNGAVFRVNVPINSIMLGVFIFMLFNNGCVQGISAEEECNLYDGEWVPDPAGPSYDETCAVIEAKVNCIKNGRPDTEYLHWRWKPHGCSAPPRLDAESFLSSMRDKSWAFIGDSILRNQMQSLTCMLSKAEKPIKVYEGYKSWVFYFPSYNFTITTVWSPFLLQYESKPSQEIQVYLDDLDDNWTSNYTTYDYVVIASGQWYLRTMLVWENNQIIGCHNCGENYKDVFEYAYRQSLRKTFKFITSSEHRPFVFFRTWQPTHFEHGEWNTGGICNRTMPYGEGDEIKGREFAQLMRGIDVEEYGRVAGVAAGRGLRMEVLDTLRMSLLRPDGHPGAYRKERPFDGEGRVQYDCLHSCLPGPVDAWNDLLMKKLVDAGVVTSDHEEAGELYSSM